MDRSPLSPSRRALFVAVLLLLALGAGEVAARAVYAWRPRFDVARRRLLGEPLPAYQKCVGQAYLLYVPTPDYTVDGRREHTAGGYRGEEVAMRRRPGVARVLCLGGSTTYGWTVERADETWPAQLERRLAAELPPGVAGVEVLNGGLPYGTSAEILTHYLFKFHYWRPDLVVIDTGGNDAWAMVGAYYQPDYGHWRRPPFVPPALPPQTRWLMRSRLASFAIIWGLYGADVGIEDPLIRPEGPPDARWYPELGPVPESRRVVPREELAFVHNLEVLLDQVRVDGARVVLVPFRSAPANQYPRPVQRWVEKNEGLLRDLAASRQLAYAPFPASVVSPANWTDNCHLNAAGEAEKAAYLEPFVRRVLWADALPSREAQP